MTPYYRVYDNQEHATHGGKFDSLEDAEAKALELASKYPGSCFEILRCVGIAQTSKASTFWMDGEEPPEKPRYRMLEVGEMVEQGDEWEANEPGVWEPRIYRGEQTPFMQPTHRPL